MTFKRVVLIRPFPFFAREINEATNYPPLGLAYIASFLESKGVNCKIIDANLLRLEDNEILKLIEDFDPDFIGISSNIAYAKDANQISKFLKKSIGKFVVIGGPFATSMVKETLDESEADCVVMGEGELVFWNIVKNEGNLDGMRGVSYIRKGEIVNNPRESLIEDLDMIPFPAYHLLPDLKLYESRSRESPVAPVLTSRGCPYQCVYCNKNIFGSKFRKRSPENIIDEIELLVNKYNVKQIDILDDNFTLDLERAERILDMLIERKIKVHITFPNGLRADRLTKGIVCKMKKVGVYKVGVGIETGDPGIMKNIKKNLDLDKVVQAIMWFREEKITVFGFFMLGLPGDNSETMQRTIDFAKKANPHIANFAITIPMPDTELFEMIKKQGKFVRDASSVDKGYYTINEGHYELGDLKSKEVLKYQRKAYTSFYFRPSKIFEFLFLIKSMRELKWTIRTALPLLKGIFKFSKDN
jgi:radical SAM superfamily enzyme YgiQ (UPF0313 family)